MFLISWIIWILGSLCFALICLIIIVGIIQNLIDLYHHINSPKSGDFIRVDEHIYRIDFIDKYIYYNDEKLSIPHWGWQRYASKLTKEEKARLL